jgi:hypothetical protein
VIWVKRLAPLVLILAVWFGYHTYDKYRAEKFAADVEHRALVTAQVWVAAAEWRADPAKYLAWRDSVLKVNSLSTSEMDGYLKLLQADPSGRQEFATRVNHYVDSMVAIKDSLRLIERKRILDSIRTAIADSARKAGGR